MARLLPSQPVSLSPSAIVRARASITQQELGDLLGVTKAQVAHVEAGRRGYSARAQARLTRLLELLPARLFRPGGALAGPAETAAADLPAGPNPSEQANLRRRLCHCRRTLSLPSYAAQGRPRVVAVLARRTQVLAALRAALTAETAPGAAPDPGTNPAHDLAWV